MRTWISLARIICLVVGNANLGSPSSFAAAAPVAVENPRQIHALVIGIDDYQHLPRLKGAVADARDIESSLRAIGVDDVTALINLAADRDKVLKTIDDISSRIHRGDLMILSIAGHGAQEPEHVKGSESDGKDAVFLLAGFEPSAQGTRQRILDNEFNHFIKTFEALGARVLFLADTCSGGGLARDVDPRAADIIYRSVPAYALSDDELKPVSTPSDAFTSELDFSRSIFLAAVDKNSKAPEIKVPGVDGYRGALSYAFARALEGSADTNGDGKITIDELFSYVREVTYQLSDERQTIVSASAPSLDINNEPVLQLTRSVTIVTPPTGLASAARTKALAPDTPESFTVTQAAAEPSVVSSGHPVRLAILNGSSGALAGVVPYAAKFEIVAQNQNPDLLWDQRSEEVISGGDVIAHEIAKDDIPNVVDRAAAIRVIKQLAAKSIQPMALLPDNRLHHLGKQVEVEIDQLTNRSLLLFNIAADGTVQLLYPQTEAEKIIMREPIYKLPIKVRGPFGADQIVAVTSPNRMVEIEQALARMNVRRMPGQLVDILARYLDASVKIGSIGVFTAP